MLLTDRSSCPSVGLYFKSTFTIHRSLFFSLFLYESLTFFISISPPFPIYSIFYLPIWYSPYLSFTTVLIPVAHTTKMTHFMSIMLPFLAVYVICSILTMPLLYQSPDGQDHDFSLLPLFGLIFVSIFLRIHFMRTYEIPSSGFLTECCTVLWCMPCSTAQSKYQIIMHDSTLIPCYLPSFLFLGILIFQNIYSFLFLSLNYDYLRSFCFTKRYYILDFNFFSFYIFFRTSFLHNCG